MNKLFLTVLLLSAFITPLGYGASLPVPPPQISIDGVYSQDTRTPFDAIVCVETLDIHTGPGFGYSVWSQVIKGDRLHIHERQGAWAMVAPGLWVNRLGLCGDA
jgi:uncharacterized protein YgiM (DUF1202 family)